MTDQEFIARELIEFFKDEPHKAVLWMITDNPMFGGISPASLIALRGDIGLNKVKRFVEASKEMNSLPEMNYEQAVHLFEFAKTNDNIGLIRKLKEYIEKNGETRWGFRKMLQEINKILENKNG
jgi:hypothetical protein